MQKYIARNTVVPEGNLTPEFNLSEYGCFA